MSRACQGHTCHVSTLLISRGMGLKLVDRQHAEIAPFPPQNQLSELSPSLLPYSSLSFGLITCTVTNLALLIMALLVHETMPGKYKEQFLHALLHLRVFKAAVAALHT